MSLIVSSSKGFGTNRSKDFVSYPMYDTTKLLKPFSNYGFFSNYAVTFAGAQSSYVTDIGDNNAMDGLGKDFSVEMWVWVNAYTTGGSGVVISQRGPAAGGWMFCVVGVTDTGNTGKLIFATGSGSQYTNGIVPLKTWTHIALTVKYGASTTGTAKLFINGNLDISYTGWSAITAPNNGVKTVYVGKENLSGDTYSHNGRIDELRFWNYTRPDADIKANYNKTLTGTESGLIVYLDFEEGTGNPKNKVTGAPCTIASAPYSSNTPILDESRGVQYLLPTLDKDVQTYYNNVLGNAGTMSFRTLLYIQDFTVYMKSKGLWDKMAEICPFVGGNLKAALTKLKHRGSPYMIPTNLTDAEYNERDSSAGIQGNGSNRYINTMNSGGYNNRDGHWAAYWRGTESNGTSRVLIGHEITAGSSFSYIGWINGGQWDVGTLAATGAPTEYTPQSQTTKLQGMGMITINGTSQTFYQNGGQLGSSVTGGSGVVPVVPIGILAVTDNSGSPGTYSTRAIMFFSVGGGLNAAQAGDLYTAVQTLQGKLNRTV